MRAARLTAALVAAVLVGTLLVPATASGAPTAVSRAAPMPANSAVARAVVPSVAVYDAPEAAGPRLALANPTITDGELVFLVESVRTDGWVNVLLPVKPNGSTGWVRAGDVEITENPYRLVVHVRRHRLDVFDAGQRTARYPIGVGKESTPTPGGRYYITQLFAPPNPDGPYGPYAYALSGFSEVLTSFRGGDAIIGIHGTNRPDLIGQDVSAGCIRMSNDDVTRLTRVLPLGTPVEIKR
jgi:lipoprotein-anchoring transpeptidase ErfK/SrfK